VIFEPALVELVSSFGSVSTTIAFEKGAAEEEERCLRLR
jgi:hypothetical protein